MQKLPVYNIQSFEFYSNAFYANNLASHIKEHGFIERPHRHDFYLTMLFTNGTGTHEIDFESYPVKKGAVFFLNPGQVHLWNLSDDSDGYIFFHTKEFYDIIYVNRQLQDFPFFATSQAAPYMVLEGEEMETAKDIFIRILKRYSSPPSAYKFETLATLCDLLYLSLAAQYFTASDVPHKSPLYVKRFYEFLKLVEERFKNLKYPGQYADLMNVSSKHLNRICMETVDKTPGQIIAERVILEAKRLLARSTLPVKEIAFDLGFDDTSYFIRFFRKQTGQTPLVFQKGLI